MGGLTNFGDDSAMHSAMYSDERMEPTIRTGPGGSGIGQWKAYACVLGDGRASPAEGLPHP